MGENMVYIPDVRQGMGHWTVRITITEDMPTLVGYRHGTRYKRYIFTDDKGNTIPAIVYGHVIRLFENALLLHGVYHISNANVKTQTGQNQMHGYPMNWVLERQTLIRPQPTEQPNLQYFLDGITPLNKVTQDMADAESIIDIMAIVIKSGDSKSIDTKFGESTVQQFKLVDDSQKPLALSIWDQQIEHYGPILVTAAVNYSVVVIKRVKVKNYKGLSLGSNNGTSFTINPQIEPLMKLRSWFDSIRETELPNWLAEHSVAYSKNVIDQDLEKKYSIGEIIARDQVGDFWSRAFLQFTEGNEQVYYIGCGSCSTRVNSPLGINYYCFSCKNHAVAAARPIVSMDVFDHNGRITVGAIESVAEEILQCSAAQLETTIKEGTKLELQAIKDAFHNKMYIVVLRCSNSKIPDTPKRFLLVGYSDDTMPPAENSSSSTTTASCSYKTTTSIFPIVSSPPSTPSHVPFKAISDTISPLKRQLQSTTTKSGRLAKKAEVVTPSDASSSGPQDCHLDASST